MRYHRLLSLTTAYVCTMAALTGCGQENATIPDTPRESSERIEITQERSATTNTIPTGDITASLRDNTPVCLIPIADGTTETHNDVAVIDASHAEEGYVMANYTGTCPKVKLRITGPDTIVYTYDLHGSGYETFPLSSGDGMYDITIYENISGTSYSTCLFAQVEVTITNSFGPFLYPNQYVNFTQDSATVQMGADLAEGATNDLGVITNIYDYIISSISYDRDKAASPPTGYTTDIDDILTSGKGICLDYAAVMAAMLRSQQIPTRLEVGYAGDAYHAWISIYTEETGWLSGIIEFTDHDWTLVDPTFGASSSEKDLKKFIGDGSNYTLQKMY